MRTYVVAMGFTLAVLALHGCAGDSAVVPPSLLVRKEVQELSQAEVDQFVQTIHAMKTVPSAYDPSINAYDWFVRTHLEVTSHDMEMDGAHMAPHFFPWHRRFLQAFEKELQRVSGDATMAVPYWDTASATSTDRVLSDDFMGGTGDPDDSNWVTTGPFRKGQWTIEIQDPERELGGSLARSIGALVALPTATKVQEVMQIPTYDVAPYNETSDLATSFRNASEGWGTPNTMHNAVHGYIGGNMGTDASPNDPIFWLHHANVDRLWDQWQARFGNATFPAAYQIPMLTWNVLPSEAFDLRAEGVRYSAP